MHHGEKIARAVFRVFRIDCGGSTCVKALRRELYKLDGVLNVSINYFVEKLYVDYDSSKISLSDIMEAVRKIGYRIYEDVI